ncbi:unnamed protein product [Arabidopsis thaliana]|uniref:(thale cress) hypothetical protein n=1 Tax=Arabidopsis thaliana TaxID=3702 RepID=A0A7G2DYN9_ARATH|nr:unnamed protein product [Arabidopsis thaliana]
MDMETTFGGRTKPVTIASDETMGVFLAMHFELEDLSLFVSKQTVDGGSEDGGTSQTSSYGFADKGKSPLYVNAERSPNYESVVWKKLMYDEAVLRWMRSMETEGQNVGDSSTNVQQHPVRPAVEAASPMLTNESMDTATEDGDQEEYSTVVEADLLKNLGLPSINLATESYDSLSEGEAYNDENDYPGGETIKECNFFGPSATNLVEPLGVHLDLAVPLHEALEDMCLNFASFNRDAAPTLDEQGEEGRVGMELAIRDVVYEGDELFVGRVFKNKQDCNVKLAVHALNRRFHFCRDRSCKKLMTLTCISETCPWRVYIVKLEDSDNYQIRIANLEHTCTVEEKSNYHRAATTRVIGSIIQSKREAARTEASPLPPKMREVVHRNFEKSVRFAVHRLDRYDYEIREEGASIYHVKLMERTCSCRAFDLLHLPCPHAIAAAVVEGVPIQGLMAPEYSVESWRMSYLGTIKPVPEVGNVFALPEPIASLRLFPPATRRPSGRPKKKRITSRGEFTGPQRQVTRCSRCTGSGHNRATSKMPI